MGPHTSNHKLLICCSHLASGGKKVTQAAVHLLQLGDQAPQVALGALREEFLRDGGKKRLGVTMGPSPGPAHFSKPRQQLQTLPSRQAPQEQAPDSQHWFCSSPAASGAPA